MASREIRIAGSHQCVESRFPNGSYDLYADPKTGVVTCRGCGATNLLPRSEALLAAGDSVKRLDAFERAFHRQARKGLRSPSADPWRMKQTPRPTHPGTDGREGPTSMTPP